MAEVPRRKKSSKPPPEASSAATGMVDLSKVKKEPEQGVAEPTILAAEAFTHGGIRKAKFEPKVPVRRQKKPVAVKSEPREGSEAELPNELIKLVKQSQEDAAARAARRSDIRAPVRVAFGFGSATAGRAAASFYKGGASGTGGHTGTRIDKKPSIKSLEGSLEDGMVLDEKGGKVKKGVTETWDLSKHYPVTLPLRKPFSGSAEQLDEEEFGEATSRDLDENAMPAAEELELMRENDEDRLLFFQIPSFLPLSKAAAGGSARVPESSSSSRHDDSGASTSLDKFPAGHMGKLRVYSSGTVKLQLGDVVLEAVPGSQCVFAQQLATINSVSRHCCFLGDVGQRIVLVPSMDDLLNSASDEFR